MAQTADYKLDFRDAIASMALLELTRTFRKMKSNQTLEVSGLDADTRSDLFKLLPALSYELIDVEEQNKACMRVHLRKT